MHHVTFTSAAAMAFILTTAPSALAQSKLVAAREGVVSDAGRDAPSVTPAPAPQQPYWVPFVGRGVNGNNSVRLDTTIAPFTKDAVSALATTMTLSGSYRVTESIAVGARIGVDRVAFAGEDAKFGFLNPSITGQYAWRLGRRFRMAASLSASFPVGSGGGNKGDEDLVSAHKAATLARGGLENAMFAVNDFTLIYGADIAYVYGGLTAQVGVGLATSFRARGDQVQPDTFKANSTYNVSLGYFVSRNVSLGTEFHYQHYVSTPSSVAEDPEKRRNLSVAVGIRSHFPVGARAWMRPGVSYAHGIVGPIETNGYQIVQVDVPVTF